MVYQIISLILIFCFYLSYVIKNYFLIRKKINVNQLGKNDQKQRKVIIFEKVLKILTILMFLIQIISILINDNWYIINVPPYIKIIGIIIMFIANVIFILSLLAMKDNWRVGISIDDKTNLVTSGIYKYSRNPAFLGFDLLYIGLLFVFPNPINLIFTIILIWMFDFQIKYEEQYLLSKFSCEYKKYCESVGRYFIIF